MLQSDNRTSCILGNEIADINFKEKWGLFVVNPWVFETMWSPVESPHQKLCQSTRVKKKEECWVEVYFLYIATDSV